MWKVHDWVPFCFSCLVNMNEEEWRVLVCVVCVVILNNTAREWMNEKSLIFPDPSHYPPTFDGTIFREHFALYFSIRFDDTNIGIELKCWRLLLLKFKIKLCVFCALVLFSCFCVFVFRSENWWMPSQCLLCSSWVLCNMKKKLSDLNLDYIPFFCYCSPSPPSGWQDGRQATKNTNRFLNNKLQNSLVSFRHRQRRNITTFWGEKTQLSLGVVVRFFQVLRDENETRKRWN